MRKILSILLSVIAFFVMCSCSVVSQTAPGSEYGSFTIEKASSYDGKYYDFGTGFTLESDDDLTTPGKKTVRVSYDPGGGWRELTAEYSFMME